MEGRGEREGEREQFNGEDVVMVGCLTRPDFNGTWVPTDAYAEYLEHSRPTYTLDNTFFAYYWLVEDGGASGWFIGSVVGGDGLSAYHPDTISADLPNAGWKIWGGYQYIDDPGEFMEDRDATVRK